MEGLFFAIGFLLGGVYVAFSHSSESSFLPKRLI